MFFLKKQMMMMLIMIRLSLYFSNTWKLKLVVHLLYKLYNSSVAWHGFAKSGIALCKTCLLFLLFSAHLLLAKLFLFSKRSRNKFSQQWKNIQNQIIVILSSVQWLLCSFPRVSFCSWRLKKQSRQKMPHESVLGPLGDDEGDVAVDCSGKRR